MAIADKLLYLAETKNLLRDAINGIGGGLSVDDPFRQYAGELLRDQATLRLDFDQSVYGVGSHPYVRDDSKSFFDLITFTRSTGGGVFNQFGLYEWVAADVPRIDHDPATLGSSTDSITLGYGIMTINTDYEYPVGETVVVSYDASNYMIGKVLGSSATAVTLNVVTVVGSGTYSEWTLIVRLGLLVEESRTNLVLYSDAFDNAAWAKFGLSVTTDAANSPEGTFTADKITPFNGAALSGSYAVQAGIAKPSGAVVTFSVFAKSDGFDRATILIQNSATASDRVVFSVSLTTGQVVSSLNYGNYSVLSSHVSPIPDDWYRIAISIQTSTEAAVSTRLYAVDSVASAGDGSSGIFIWGAQLEVGSFPTSCIPTTAAAVTRAADLTSRTLGSEYNPAEGTLIVTAKAPAVGDTIASLGSASITSDSVAEKTYAATYSTSNPATVLELNPNATFSEIRYIPRVLTSEELQAITQ